MGHAHSEPAEAQVRFSRIKDSHARCLEDRHQFRAELEQVRDELLDLEDRIRDPGFPDYIERYEATRSRFEGLKEQYHDNEEILHRLEETIERATDDLPENKSGSRPERKGSRPATTTHRYFYSYASGPASGSGSQRKSSHHGRSEKPRDSGRGHHSREARPDFQSSCEGKRGPTTHHYHYGPPPFSHGDTEDDSPDSSRYEDSHRGYFTRETRPDYASSSRPNMPRESHSHHQDHRHNERPHYSDREHTNQRAQDSDSRSRYPESGPSRTSSPEFPPSAQTVASWRKYVDHCFADYAKIKNFPHPPVVKDENWEHNLKVFFLSLGDYDLKKQRLRWHPDKFSACAADKQEEWKGFAKEIFVVMNEARKERERDR